MPPVVPDSPALPPFIELTGVNAASPSSPLDRVDQICQRVAREIVPGQPPIHIHLLRLDHVRQLVRAMRGRTLHHVIDKTVPHPHQPLDDLGIRLLLLDQTPQSLRQNGPKGKSKLPQQVFLSLLRLPFRQSPPAGIWDLNPYALASRSFSEVSRH